MSLHVEVTGSGPDLALLHGWGMHGGVWAGVQEELAQRFRVHVVDLPGYGASPACEPYELAQLAQIVAHALPAGIQVIGWSMGGLVAQRWALDRPEQVTKLMLLGSSPCFVQRPDWACGIEAEVLRGFARDLGQDYVGTLLRFLSLQVRNGENLRTVMKYLRHTLFARAMPDASVLLAGLQVLLETDQRHEIQGLRPPLAILHGERDMLAPADAARWLARQLPGTRLDMLAGCAHAPFLSHPREFVRSVQEFFDE